MSETIQLTLPYPPSTNTYYRYYRKRVVISAHGRQYKRDVAFICKQGGVTPLSGSIIANVKVFQPTRRGDLDNKFKALFDALNGLAYDDDRQIMEIHAWKYVDNGNPRIEIELLQRVYQRKML
ncbi:MAG: RusA family crossover junction endodeoxyribonuclease [Aggregatilineales bacterium]